jgi:hypothetical protein
MKKTGVLGFVIISGLFYSYYSSANKVNASAKPALVTYDYNIAPLVATYCAPCHFPDKRGNKKALNTYISVSSQADEILRRIQLNPANRGFMPKKNPKLSENTIAVFKQWKADGLLAK